jgi:RNA polymerase sigma-70 factor (ECF subfamily)
MEATITDLYFNHQRQLKAKADPVTDEQLILEYRRTGNREYYAQLVYRYERELFTYLRRYLGSAELAEDVFQATFLMVHLKCEMFEEGRSFRPWLYTIATNKAIDVSRHNKRNKAVSLDSTRDKEDTDTGALSDLLESSEGDPADALSQTERIQAVRAALEQLPESMLTVIHLVYYQGLKYREAAETLNVPVGTVKSRLHSAIAKLGEVWKTIGVD